MFYLLIGICGDHFCATSMCEDDLRHYAYKKGIQYPNIIPCRSKKDAINLLSVYAEENGLIAPKESEFHIQTIVHLKKKPPKIITIDLNS